MRDAITAFNYTDPEVEKITVKISGCPNGCGQHHLGGIGLQGSSYKAGRLEVPCYDVFIGGSNYIGAERMGTRVSRVLAKKAHLAIDKITRVYVEERLPDETFLQYVDRVGPKSFESHLEEFKWVGPINLEPDMYMDWGSEEVFQVIRGEGECAAGAVPVRQGVVESVVNLD
jgi:sulfite reductase beta subunit-like hemoprotein